MCSCHCWARLLMWFLQFMMFFFCEWIVGIKPLGRQYQILMKLKNLILHCPNCSLQTISSLLFRFDAAIVWSVLSWVLVQAMQMFYRECIIYPWMEGILMINVEQLWNIRLEVNSCLINVSCAGSRALFECLYTTKTPYSW